MFRHLDGLPVGLRVELCVPATTGLDVVSGTILAVHRSVIFTIALAAASVLAPEVGAQVAPPVPQNAIERTADGFRVTRDGQSVEMSLQEPPPTPFEERERVVFRKDDRWVVWDSRGLSLRDGEHLRSSRLTDVPTSPRVFSEEEILENWLLVLGGIRTKEAQSLLGARRVGSLVYLLFDWKDIFGNSWLQALVKVDLDAPVLEWRYAGRFEGQAVSIDAPDDRLRVFGEEIGVVSRSGDAWGIATFDPSTETFAFRALGSGLVEVRSRSRGNAHFLESTPYGMTVIGRLHLPTGSVARLVETRGAIRLIDGEVPWVAVERNEQGRFLRNLETGAVVPVPIDAGIRRVGNSVLFWSPADRPNVAILVDPARWSVLANWSSTPVPPNGAQPGPLSAAANDLSRAEGRPVGRSSPTRNRPGPPWPPASRLPR